MTAQDQSRTGEAKAGEISVENDFQLDSGQAREIGDALGNGITGFATKNFGVDKLTPSEDSYNTDRMCFLGKLAAYLAASAEWARAYDDPRTAKRAADAFRDTGKEVCDQIDKANWPIGRRSIGDRPRPTQTAREYPA